MVDPAPAGITTQGNPAEPPGPGWSWRGTGPPGSNEGAWFNPDTGQSLHPDFNHPGDVPPHYDYTVGGGPKSYMYPGDEIPELPVVPDF